MSKFSEFHLANVGDVFVLFIILYVIYLLSLVTYNIYFHPLAAFPGPKLWAATRLPFAYHLCCGDLVFRIRDLHDIYGHVVRTGPDELSYTSNVWKDIYGLRRGYPEFRKDGRFYPADGHLITANTVDHTRIRKLLAHAFSETALRGQEATIVRYVDLLVTKLREDCGNGKNPLNIVNYYNWTTFDLIGDLTLGESFGCLHDTRDHPWVRLIFEGVKAATFGQATRYFPGMTRVLEAFVPQSMMDKKDAHEALSRERVLKRVKQGVDRPGTVDFMTEVLAHNYDEKDSDGKSRGMSLSELGKNASLLITAGSETTATLLSGVTYLLLTHPSALARAVDEVRTAFKQDSDIDFASVSRLRYMIACLEEALRLYPPAPIGLPRSISGKGTTIDGVWVPGGTTVSVHSWATSHSARHFTDPNVFVPSRHLDDERDLRYESDNRDAVQPFSVGPRSCIGKTLAHAEMRLMLAKILWNFDLQLARDGNGEEKNWITSQKVFILWEKGPLNVLLQPVKQA